MAEMSQITTFLNICASSGGILTTSCKTSFETLFKNMLSILYEIDSVTNQNAPLAVCTAAPVSTALVQLWSSPNQLAVDNLLNNDIW